MDGLIWDNLSKLFRSLYEKVYYDSIIERELLGIRRGLYFDIQKVIQQLYIEVYSIVSTKLIMGNTLGFWFYRKFILNM